MSIKCRPKEYVLIRRALWVLCWMVSFLTYNHIAEYKNTTSLYSTILEAAIYLIQLFYVEISPL